MADANHSAPTSFHDCFVPSPASVRHRRAIPPVRLVDRAPPILYLKLSGRWIEAAGFVPEQRLKIEVTHERLVITPLDETERDNVGKDGRAEIEPAAQRQRRFSVIAGGAQ